MPATAPVAEPGGRLHKRRVRVLFEWLLIAIVTLACSLLIRTFIAQAFYIPSESMLPTLHVGDRVIVYKAGYRLSGINRGDVVVFRRPDPYYDIDELIKRVVAVGGETFELQDGVVYIDGEPLDEPYLEPDTVTLPKWPIPDCGDIPRSDRCEVPEGKVLVLGDNREGQPGWPVLRARGR